MALSPTPTIDYSDKDFDSLRSRLINLIGSVFPDWTDFNVSSFGNILMELYCHVGDVLGYYLDAHAIESRIATATQRRSLIALAKLLNYTPGSATAAQVVCTISLSSPPTSADVVFPAGTIVKTAEVTDPIEFQLLTEVSITVSPPISEVDGTFEHSKTFTEYYTSTDAPSQEIVLGSTPFIDDSEDISASNGSYTKVDNFLSSTSSDRHYMVIVDQNDRATVRFGNGVNGELPVGTITGVYKTGGGSDGNVAAGSITRIVGNFYDGATQVFPTVTNDLAASGGGPRDTVEEIRNDAPQSIRAINRTVAREDYEINAKRVSGVQRALMLTSNEDSRIAENAGNLSIIPVGGGTATQTLLDDVLTMVTVTYPNTLTFSVSVVAASYLTVNIQATVYLASGQSGSVVASRIQTNLAAYFALENADGSENENVGFGYDYEASGQGVAAEIPYSDIYNVIRDTTGVYKIDDGIGSVLLNGEASDLTIGVDQFPVLGTVTLINAATGGSLG